MFHKVMNVSIVLSEESTGKMPPRCFSSAEMNCHFGAAFLYEHEMKREVKEGFFC